MDWEAFKNDALASVNEGLATRSAGNISEEDAFSVAIGETWQGALYGIIEDALGRRKFRMFEHEKGQADWFRALQDALTR